MKKLPLLPKNLVRLEEGEKFAFACHERVACFTDCCRQLELALTPYDMLRLKNELSMHSSKFLDTYVIIECDDEEDVFPRLYLTMVDDGRASCVFVTEKGCSVYQSRPGACRAYPMGRAAMRTSADDLDEYYVLLNEDHCLGFKESPEQTSHQYCHEQGLKRYNEMNDALIPILQHESIRQGMKLSQEQIDLYVLALYDLDTFREKLFGGMLGTMVPPLKSRQEELKNDGILLLYAIDWLKGQLFEQR